MFSAVGYRYQYIPRIHFHKADAGFSSSAHDEKKLQVGMTFNSLSAPVVCPPARLIGGLGCVHTVDVFVTELV